VNVVDSSAWLAYFAGEPNAVFFAEAIEDTELLIVPSVCIYEVFRVVLREKGEDYALEAMAVMQSATVVDLDANLAIEAAALGQEMGLAFADSIIYTITQQNAATLWTQDVHFSKLFGVQYRAKNRAGKK
jgi:toxin FitB